VRHLRFPLSWLGAVFFGGYALLALAVRLRDIFADDWVMRDFMSGIISAPGWFILRLFGCDRETMIVPAMLITAVLAYLLGAVLELVVRALLGGSGFK
jgi:hypothetical protein